MKLKRIITLLLVLLLTLTLFSSCTKAEEGYKAETMDNNTESPETRDGNSSDTEQPEDTTGSTPETTIPEGVDIELYNAAKEALIQLDDETKKEIENAFGWGNSSSNLFAKFDESTASFTGEVWCLGKFGECVVVFMKTFLAVRTEKEVAGCVFTEGSSFILSAYCNGTVYELKDAYNSGVLTKENVVLVHKRYSVVKEYKDAVKRLKYYNAAKEALIQLDESTKQDINKALGKNVGWINIDDSYVGWYSKLRCYGNYEKCKVILLPNMEIETYTVIKIGSTSFGLSCDFSLYGYCNGTLYELTEAYKKGYISQDEIELAQSRHKSIREYVNRYIKE